MRRTLRNETGVAMVTVLLIGAALTALTSAAAFVTIEEMGATQADRDAAQALSIAEAGIDRLVLEIRKGNLTWNNISFAGCDAQHPVISYSGTIGAGSYTTTLAAYNRTGDVPASQRFAPSAAACFAPPPAPARDFPIGTHEYLITSTGTTGSPASARRVVRQTLDIKPLGLPLGIYAYDRIDANGTVNMQNINMVSEGNVYNRDNLGFFGTDPYYTLGHFYGPRITDSTIAAVKMPASVHAKGSIYYGPASKLTEHRSGFEPNCVANDAKGEDGQSWWDTSGSAVLQNLTAGCDPPWPGSQQDYPSGNEITRPTPPTSCPLPLAPCLQFTEDDRKRVAPNPTLSEQDYLTLKEAARENGLYCTGSGLLNAVALSCTEANRTESANPYTVAAIGISDFNDITQRSFVIYVEFPNDGADPFLREVRFAPAGGSPEIGPCNTNPASNRSAVIVVRRGSFSAAGGSKVNGAMLIPEGALYTSGDFVMEGTVIARRIESRGTSTLRLSSCWLRNLPGPFLDTTKVNWSEVDR